MKQTKIKTPFTYDDEPVIFYVRDNIVWFETEYETLDEFPKEWIIWAAKQI